MERNEIARRAEAGEGRFKDLVMFVNNIDRFAFFDALTDVMADAGLDIRGLLKGGRFDEILEYLLTPCGLNYANLPKGLLKFH